MDDRTDLAPGTPDVPQAPDLSGQPDGRSNDIGLSVTLQPPEMLEAGGHDVSHVAYGNDFIVTSTFKEGKGGKVENGEGFQYRIISSRTGKLLSEFTCPPERIEFAHLAQADFPTKKGPNRSWDDGAKVGYGEVAEDTASIDDVIKSLMERNQWGQDPRIIRLIKSFFIDMTYKLGVSPLTRKQIREARDHFITFLDSEISIVNNWLIFSYRNRLFACQIADDNNNYNAAVNPNSCNRFSVTNTEATTINGNDKITILTPKKSYTGSESPFSETVYSEPLRHFPWLSKYCGPGAGEKIGNNTVSCKAGTITISDATGKQHLFSDSAVGYSIDAANPNILYYVSQSGELKKIEIDKIGPSTPVEAKPLPVTGTMKEFTMDTRGNFFLVLVEKDGASELFIIEKTTMKIAQKIGDVRGNVHSDSAGRIFFVDTNNHLRVANTTFASFEKGGVDKVREAAKERLARAMAALDQGLQVSGLTGAPRALTRDTVIARLKRDMEGIFGPLLDRAKTSDEVVGIAGRLTEFREGQFREFPEAFSLLDKKIAERTSALKAAEFAVEIAEADRTLNTIDTPQAAMKIDAMINPLTQKRGSLSILDLPQRRAIDESLARLKARAGEVKTHFADRIIQYAESLVTEIEDMINGPDTPVSLEELAAIKDSDKVRDFERALTHIDSAKAQPLRARYITARTNKLIALKKAAQEAEGKIRNAQALLIDDAGRVLLDLETEMDETTFDDVRGFRRWLTRNSLITRFREIILGLPDTLRQEQEAKLDALTDKRQRDIEHRKVVEAKSVEGEATFAGGFRLPVFRETPAVWQPKFIPATPEGEGSGEYGELVFEDTHGRVFNPSIGLVKMDTDDPDTKAVIDAYMSSAKRFFDGVKARQVPHAGDNFRNTEHHRAKVAELAENLSFQLKYHMGMLIVEGEAGVGKNVGIDTLAEAINYEPFTFACNGQTEKEDMTYTYEYDAAKGTYRLNAKFIEALTTPGTLIVLDEVNTLPTPVAKMLNGLLDYRRELHLPDGRVIKPDPSVLIVGTMNPKSYLGTKPLAPEFNDRSLTMLWSYPSEKRKSNGTDLYTADEASVLATYVPCLEKLSLDEFTILWDYVVNDDKTNGADRIIDLEKETACKQLHLVVTAANRAREAYTAFQTAASSEAISFVFSTRTAIYIAMHLRNDSNVNQVIRDVVVPKIGDPQERDVVGTIIDNAVLPPASSGTGTGAGGSGTTGLRAVGPDEGTPDAGAGEETERVAAVA